MSVRQTTYEISLQPMTPITGQSRLTVKSMRATFDDAYYYGSQVPEDWDITWETGAMQTLTVEYKKSEDKFQIM